VQLLLGVEAWMVKFSSGELPDMVPLTVPGLVIRTAHVLVGASILSTATAAAVWLHRRTTATAVPAVPASARLEGAA